MKLGEIVLQKKVKDHDVVIRYMDKDDAEAMRKYINDLSRERTFVTFQGEELSLEEEQEYVEDTKKKMEASTMVKLLLFVDQKMLGTTEITLRDRTQAHVGGFALSVDASVRGMGFGRLLMETVIREAKKELKGLKIIELTVFANNPIAISLYKSLGFKEAGVVPGKISYKGEYVDEIIMYLQV